MSENQTTQNNNCNNDNNSHKKKNFRDTIHEEKAIATQVWSLLHLISVKYISKLSLLFQYLYMPKIPAFLLIINEIYYIIL